MITPAEQGRTGTVLVAASAVAFSTAGLFSRLVALDVWTVLFWRGLFGGLFIAAYIAWRHRRAGTAVIRAMGWSGLLAALCSTAATICFINALRLSTVADVMVIGATTPFVAAGLGWLLAGDRERASTLIASAAALGGVGVMFSAAMPSGQLLGDLLALAMTILMSTMMVIIRLRRATPMLPAASLSAFLCPLVVLPLAHPAAPDAEELVLLALFGAGQFGLGLLLMTLGARLISASRAALIGALDTPLAPIWVFLAFGEMPATTTWIGGSIVMAAVVADIWFMKSAAAPATQAAGQRRPDGCPPAAGRGAGG
ncbi:MAG: EamA family transporter [Alphaproteobacteria bacterium]|nr:EamA family transporter [Alphaproteobacteria bacterium]